MTRYSCICGILVKYLFILFIFFTSDTFRENYLTIIIVILKHKFNLHNIQYTYVYSM